ncbi:excinuclease ABC subunit A [Trinickia fusca]|uniref:Excinuclease ABC subunit A n=1 Tax=Trinickia fusca TaxID=2419777 RepID=A0A494XJ47_9BURK|nr:excinuclease ABC subunit A [Trinickia fusca]RKP50700.1 excinuclease ABC subunit A [Trinickia fusca]
MKRHLLIAAVLTASLAATHAFARNSIDDYSIDDALKSSTGEAKVGDDIGLYFAGQPHAAVVKKFGEFQANKKTNAFGKSDEAACQHVFLSAVLELQKRARKEGGNAVINIKSNYYDKEKASATEYTCGAGALMAGVTLKGDVVTLKTTK